MQKKVWNKLWNPRWQPRSGCDGRVMAKILITIQVNLVPIPSEACRRLHKFAWIVVITKFSIILPSQPLLGRHLGFHNFFHVVFFAWATPFLQLGCFCVDYLWNYIYMLEKIFMGLSGSGNWWRKLQNYICDRLCEKGSYSFSKFSTLVNHISSGF